MFEGLKIGIGITGSFCSLKSCLLFLKELKSYPVDLYVFVSENVFKEDTRFLKQINLLNKLKKLLVKK